MKRYFCVLIMIASAAMFDAVRAQGSGSGVTINGVTWAESNVGLQGRFMENSTEPGLYYTLDEALVACPAGWRLPTRAEFELLSQSPVEWVEEGGISGVRIGRGAEGTIFLPAGGWRYERTDYAVGYDGVYWTSTQVTPSSGNYFRFAGTGARPTDHAYRTNGLKVRCVRR